MSEHCGMNEIELAAEIRRSITYSSFRSHASSFRSISSLNSAHRENDNDISGDEYELQWAAVQRLPTFERITTALFDKKDNLTNVTAAGNSSTSTGKRVANITELGAEDRHVFIEKLTKHIENDNMRLLQKIRKRFDGGWCRFAQVEVTYKNLHIEAGCVVVHGKPLPRSWNAAMSILLRLANFSAAKRDAKLSSKPGRYVNMHTASNEFTVMAVRR